jgi:hypothetical protein
MPFSKEGNVLPFILQLAQPLSEESLAAATSTETKGATGGDGKVGSDSATDSDHHSIEWGL